MRHPSKQLNFDEILPPNVDQMTEREILEYWGFDPEEIVDFPDGSASPAVIELNELYYKSLNKYMRDRFS